MEVIIDSKLYQQALTYAQQRCNNHSKRQGFRGL